MTPETFAALLRAFALSAESGDGARFAGRAGVPSHTVYEGGMDYGGMPAKPVREWVRELHALKMLLKRQDRQKDGRKDGHD